MSSNLYNITAMTPAQASNAPAAFLTSGLAASVPGDPSGVGVATVLRMSPLVVEVAVESVTEGRGVTLVVIPAQ